MSQELRWILEDIDEKRNWEDMVKALRYWLEQAEDKVKKRKHKLKDPSFIEG